MPLTLLDKGPETIRAWPSVEVTDGSNYEGPERRPGPEHVDIERVFMLPASVPTRSAARYSENAAEGELAFLGYTVIGRDLSALDPWAEVEWPVGSGRFFDVQGWPAHHTYPPKLAHYQARLVGRGESPGG